LWLFIFKDAIVLEPWCGYGCYVYNGIGWDWIRVCHRARYHIEHGRVTRIILNHHEGYCVVTKLTNVLCIYDTSYQKTPELSDIHIKPEQILAEIQAFPERLKMTSFWDGDVRFIL
jgi:hypothetical protein